MPISELCPDCSDCAIAADDNVLVRLLDALQMRRFTHQGLNVTKSAGVSAGGPGRKRWPVAQQLVTKPRIEIYDRFCRDRGDWLPIHFDSFGVHTQKFFVVALFVLQTD
jgi:hypothetical protein